MAPKLRRSHNVAIDGDKLTAAREKAGLTQTQLAAEVGISQSYISGIEMGDRPRVSPMVYASLCRVLGVSEPALRADPTPVPPNP